jgi:hypothetical protein
MVTVLILIVSWLLVILSQNSSMIFGARLIGKKKPAINEEKKKNESAQYVAANEF